MKIFAKIWPVLFIAITVSCLFLANYHPGTILTGGDNLHPEYNLGLNLKRAIFSVWQEYQSLGLLGGMGHAADLLRILFLLPLTLIFPLEFLRYFWTFLTLLIGSVGAYFLIKKLLSMVSAAYAEIPVVAGQVISLLGALFYLLNLSTLQSYYTPFEVFTAHFAFLPWLLLATVNFFQHKTRKNILLLSLILFLATPASYVPTLFVVFLIASFFIALFSSFHFPSWKDRLKNIFHYHVIVFIINSFWLLPFAYFTLTNSSVNVTAKINQMATQNIYEMNKEFGDVLDVALLKGFWFNNIEPNLLATNDTYMFLPWKQYLQNPLVTAVGIVLFLVVLFGVVQSVRLKNKENSSRNKVLLGFTALFILSVTMLLTATPPFSWIDDLFRNYVPLAGQVFRFPFTKFSILASLTYAMFFSIGVYALYLWGEKKNIAVLYQRIVAVLLGLLLVFYTFPMFTGHLFYEKETIKLPIEYTDLFSYLKTQDQTARIADFPQDTFWSWHFYDFGYSGSGFLWYGIEQPILDRAFDVWSSTSEQYYYEMTQALYAQDAKAFNDVLEKYQIQFLLVDKNIINNTSPKALFTDQMENLIKQNPHISQVKSFGNLTLYKVSLQNKPQNFVFQVSGAQTVNSFVWSNSDIAFSTQGDYISTSQNPDYQYPLQSLFSLKNTSKNEYSVSEDNDSVYLSNPIQISSDNESMKIPDYLSNEQYLPANFYMTTDSSSGKKLLRIKIETPQILINNKKVWGNSIDNPVFLLPTNATAIRISLNGNAPLTVDSNNSVTVGLLTKRENILTLTTTTGAVSYVIPPEYFSELFNTSDEITLPKSTNKKDSLSIKFLKVKDGVLGKEVDLHSFTPVKNCDRFRDGDVYQQIQKDNGKDVLILNAQHATACTSSYLPLMPHDQSYLFFVQGKNIQGRNLHIWVLNEDEQHAPYDNYVEKEGGSLTSFIVPPMEGQGRSYSIHLDSISISHDKSYNEISRVSAYFVPANFITALVVAKDELPADQNFAQKQTLSVSHPNESLYSVNGFSNGPQTMVLSQSFDPQWKAYDVPQINLMSEIFPFVFGKEIKTHVKVNNWENGWQLMGGDQKIVIVYLPQYLEYFGFFLLFGYAISLLWIKKSSVWSDPGVQNEEPVLLEADAPEFSQPIQSEPDSHSQTTPQEPEILDQPDFQSGTNQGEIETAQSLESGADASEQK